MKPFSFFVKPFLFLLLLTSTALAQVPNYVPSNGLVGYWPFSGNANDESGNGNDGTVNGATLTTDRNGLNNKAYLFNGSGNYITVPNSISLQFNGEISFSAWLYASAFPSPVSYWFSKGADGGTPNSWTSSVDAANKKATVSIFNNNNQNCGTSSTTSLQLNNWIHVVETFNGSFARTYVNGVLESTTPCSYTTFSNTYSLIFGKRHISGLPYYWNGKIDDFGVWNRALTPTEIQQLYSDSICVPPAASITSGGLTSFCSGGNVLLSAPSDTSYTYQWQLNGSPINAATAATYTANASGNYSVIISNGASCSDTSSVTTVTINPLPTATITAAGSTTFCTGASVVLNANTGTGLTYQWKLNGNNISGATAASYTATAAGSYTVVVTNTSTCSATSSATSVTVNPLPTATITAAGSTTFCAGGNVVLNANTGTGLSYQWKLNGNNISGATAASYNATAAGSYTLIVTANACNATSIATNVIVNPVPTVTLAPLSPFININSPSINMNGTPSGGTYEGSGISGASFQPQQAGLGATSVIYSYTTPAGCSANASQSTIVYDTTGTVCTSYINDTTHYSIYDTTLVSVTDTLFINMIILSATNSSTSNTIRIYPNPAMDYLTIDNGNYSLLNGYTIRIENELGQVVFNQSIVQQQFTIDLSTWTGPGMYFVTIFDAGGIPVDVRKIVLQ